MTLIYSGTDRVWKGERINGIAHPRNIGQLWSDDELRAIGLERQKPHLPEPESLESVVERLCHAVDNAAERERLKHITPGDGKAMVYREKFEEAQGVQRIGETEANQLDDDERRERFPILSASIPTEAETLWQIAEIVTDKAERWADLAHTIEKACIDGKAAIRAATTAEEAERAYASIAWGG